MAHKCTLCNKYVNKPCDRDDCPEGLREDPHHGVVRLEQIGLGTLRDAKVFLGDVDISQYVTGFRSDSSVKHVTHVELDLVGGIVIEGVLVAFTTDLTALKQIYVSLSDTDLFELVNHRNRVIEQRIRNQGRGGE